MPQLDYRVFDADNHYYEPRDCFTRHLESRYRDLAIRVEKDAEGRDEVWIGDRPFTFLANRDFDVTVKPGGLRAMLRGMREPGFKTSDVTEPVQPAYVNREARLALMDRQGLEAAILFPTLAVCVEHSMKDDPEQLYANLRSFNRWLDEEWGFAYQDRIYAPPLLSLRDLQSAVDDLEWALERGARFVSLRPGPAFGRSPADPYFDPFWARVNEAHVTVAFHIAESGYNEMMSVHWGEEANPASHRQSAFQWTNFYGDRPIMDTVSALIFHNLFGRFPNVRVLSVENGSLWAPYLMRAMDKMGGMGRNGPWIGGRITEKPSQIFRRHVFVSPHHFGEDIVALCDTLGASQVLFGSDFPHAEGLAEPTAFLGTIEKLPDAEVRMVMRDNALALVGPA